MSQVVFDFKDLIIHCLHDKEIKFTNAISLEIDSKTFISELFQNLQMVCQETELKELFKQEHFHFVQNPYVKEKIEKLVDKFYLELTNLFQVPLGKELCLYGNLQKIKHTNIFLFKALLLDPNHLIYNEQRFNRLKNLTCLFNKDEECQELLIQKTTKKIKRK
jgi:hypothetical protein